MNDEFDLFSGDVDGRFVKGIRVLGTSFILLISALLSISFYVTAGSAVFGWMPQPWMVTLSAVVLGLTGNELAVSFWLSVRSRAKNITNEQSNVVMGGVGAGWITSVLTTLGAFIVTPETSPEFLAEYASIIAFLTMTVPIILQMSLVVGFLAFSREAEIASSKANLWGDQLHSKVLTHKTLTRARLREGELAVQRHLPAYSQEAGQHDADVMVSRGRATMEAERGSISPPSPPDTAEAFVFPAASAPDAAVVDTSPPETISDDRLTNQVEVLRGDEWQIVDKNLDRVSALDTAQNHAQRGRVSRVKSGGVVVITYTEHPGIIEGVTPDGRPLS